MSHCSESEFSGIACATISSTVSLRMSVIVEATSRALMISRRCLLLRLGECLVDPGMDDRLALLEAETLQHRIHPLGPEDPHQIVFERDEEFGGVGIALAAGAALASCIYPPMAYIRRGDLALAHNSRNAGVRGRRKTGTDGH